MSGKRLQVLVVGSGIAGLSAAICSAIAGHTVVLLSPFVSERAQSVMAAGGINAALDTLGEGDSTALHAQETLKSGHFLESERAIRGLCETAPDVVEWLEELGVVFSRDAHNNVALRAFGGQSKRRTAYAGASTGKQIVSALVQKCREFEIRGSIVRELGSMFHSALIENGTCYGAVLVNPLTGQTRPVFADAVIMATGGMNKIFGKTTGSELCDGYAAGRLFKQGVQMRNLEFVQFHPTTIETSHKRMLISEAARGEGGRLYYERDGARVYFMEELYGPRGNLMPRDVVSKHIFACPSQVYLDISFLGEKLIHERLDEIYDLCMMYLGLDVTKESIPVAPSVHFFMGGIRVDDEHRTNVERLYAVGECASKYHGANRLGGNSLLAAMYSGSVAAQAVDTSVQPVDESTRPAFGGYVSSIDEAMRAAQQKRSLFPACYIQQQLAECMNHKLGIVRDATTLKAALEEIDFLLDAVSKLHFDPQVSLYENFRLGPMLLIAKAMAMSALAREETRGAHIRADFPDTREQFQANSMAEWKDGEFSVMFVREGAAGGERTCS